jgi:predicted dehydrogenase
MKNVLVCGFGSIGQKHAEHLRDLDVSVRIWRERIERGAAVRESGYTFEPDLQKALCWADAVIVATATDLHMDLACRAAEARKALYIEKPLSHDRQNVERLRAAAEGLVVEIGCQFRRHPGLIRLKEHLASGDDGPVLAFQAWVGQRLDQWRPGTDYRLAYSADTSRGGGALFDLVHEIDLIHWLVGPVQTVCADLRRNSDLEIKTEDLANLILVTKGGAAGVVQLDMLSPAYRRGLQIVCRRAVWHWDFICGTLIRDDGHQTQTVCLEPLSGKYLLRNLMEYFLKRMEFPDLPPACSLAEGIHDLDILLTARQSAASGMRLSVP